MSSKAGSGINILYLLTGPIVSLRPAASSVVCTVCTLRPALCLRAFDNRTTVLFCENGSHQVSDNEQQQMTNNLKHSAKDNVTSGFMKHEI